MEEKPTSSPSIKFDKDLVNALENCPRYALKTLGVEPTDELVAMVSQLDYPQLRDLVDAFEKSTIGKPSVESFP